MNAKLGVLVASDAAPRFGVAPWSAALAGTAGLYLVSILNYLLFHTLAELFSILVAFGIFVLAWQTRRFLTNGYLLFLGIAYLFVGAIDLVHTLAYRGMGIFPAAGDNLPTQLWIAARYLESVSLLAAALLFGRRLNHRLTLAGYGLVTAILFWTISRPGLFPDCFVAGAGLTPFKIGSEYLICLLLAGGLYLLWRRRGEFTPEVFQLLVGSILLTIVSELAFTFYTNVYGLSNLVGHIFKIASFYLIYRAIIETGLVRPYELIFRSLKQSEAALATVNTSLEARVTERTAELTRTNALLQDEVEEHRRTAVDLCRAEEKYRDIFDHAVEGIQQTTPDGRLLIANPALAAILGYSSPETLLAAIDDIGNQVYADPEDRQRFLALIHANSIAPGFETRFRRRDGELIWVSLNTRIVRDESGAIRYYEGTVADITERKRLEEQLRQAQKMETVGTLTGGIAHDFNNVLSAIIGFGSLLEMKLDKADPLYGNVTQILAAADRAANLTRSLLVFSRKQPMEMHPVDLNGILQGMEKMLRRLLPELIILEFDLKDEALTIRADSGQIEQVLLNLVTNARDALPKGGRVTIKALRVEIDQAFRQAHGFGQVGPHVLLSCIDNGQGMDEKVRQHIFEPFFTTKEVGKGTGLGLAVCHGIVEQHQGHINCYSEPGGGTTFRIYLPLVEAAPAAGATADAEVVPGGTETILVAEDEETVRRLTTTILEEAGYRVLAAADGCEAVARCREEGREIDLCLFDLVMPRKGGWEAFQEVRTLLPGLKILFTSGYQPEGEQKEALLGSGAGFIAKPVFPKDLLKKVRELLDQGPTPPPERRPHG